MNNLDWISKWSSYTPDKKAVVSLDTGQVYTYRELDEGACRIGSYLMQRFDLKTGDRLAVLSEHSPEYLMLFIATQRLGIILVPLNYRTGSTELLHCLNDVSPSLFLADLDSFGSLVEELRSKQDFPVIASHDFFAEADKWETVAFNTEFAIDTDRPVFIFYTSGTTGKPKGVLYTNRMLFWNSLNTAVQLEITSGDHTVNALPPYHTSGWNVLLLPMLHRGARVDFARKFRPGKILNYLEKQPVSLFLAVPTMLRMMVKHKHFSNFQPKRLKYIVAGGEPLAISLIDSWAEKGILISQGYGLTEAGPSITSLHYHDALWKKGSIGKPNFYVESKILDKDGLEAGTGEPGELCLRGHIVTPGYWNNSACTLEKIRDQWLYTGDIVKRDEEGFLYIIGRKNQMYISGGENIHPSEIENILHQSGLVQEAAVVGVPHPAWGEAGVAFVVLKADNTVAEEIFRHLKNHLASYKLPRDIISMDSLPKSVLGKINRKELKYLYKNIKNEKRSIG